MNYREGRKPQSGSPYFPTQKVKILLVDDTPENLVALEAARYAWGEDLILAHSGSRTKGKNMMKRHGTAVLKSFTAVSLNHRVSMKQTAQQTIGMVMLGSPCKLVVRDSSIESELRAFARSSDQPLPK